MGCVSLAGSKKYQAPVIFCEASHFPMFTSVRYSDSLRGPSERPQQEYGKFGAFRIAML